MIRRADKGSGVVIKNRTRHVVEAMRQLGDEGFYVALDKDPTSDMTEKVNNRIRKAHGCISDSIPEYLLVDSTAKAGRFYLFTEDT